MTMFHLSPAGCVVPPGTHDAAQGDGQHGHLLRPGPHEHGDRGGPGVGQRLLRDARLRRLPHLLLAAAHRARPQEDDRQETHHGADLRENHGRLVSSVSQVAVLRY